MHSVASARVSNKARRSSDRSRCVEAARPFFDLWRFDGRWMMPTGARSWGFRALAGHRARLWISPQGCARRNTSLQGRRPGTVSSVAIPSGSATSLNGLSGTPLSRNSALFAQFMSQNTSRLLPPTVWGTRLVVGALSRSRPLGLPKVSSAPAARLRGGVSRLPVGRISSQVAMRSSGRDRAIDRLVNCYAIAVRMCARGEGNQPA